jgi:hypothetical protein
MAAAGKKGREPVSKGNFHFAGAKQVWMELSQSDVHLFYSNKNSLK